MRPAPHPRRPRPTPHTTDRSEPLIGDPVYPPEVAPELPAGSGVPGRRQFRAGVARNSSLAAIGAGAVLFTVVAVSSPLSGAGVAARPTDPATSTSRSTGLDALLQNIAGAGAPTPSPSLSRSPSAAKAQAPTDPGAISTLAANGIPSVALNAYRVAAARVDHVDPSCGIDWSLIAGIGREESDHGRFGGAQLHADGTSTPRIIGPALDGTNGDRILAPTNGLALDGDATYAHALGPMQFIPTTWDGYGADANGDGKADIFNINDAALGTARYLCAAGGDLRTQQGRIKAVLTYNHSDQYLAQVLALADAYKRGVPISGIPVGNTTGSLPTLANTGSIPPANPGDPTAAQKIQQQKAAASRSAAASKSAAAGRSTAPTKSPTTPRSSGGSGGSTTGGGATGSSGSGGTTTTPSPRPSPSKTCTGLLGLPLACPS